MTGPSANAEQRRCLRASCHAALLAAFLGSSVAGAATAEVACTNAAAEITCDANRCEVKTEGFTPMAVSLSGGKLEVCAYSGCWSGPVDLRRTRGSQLIVHALVSGPVGGAVLTYDRRARFGTLQWGSYALPLSCGG